MIPNMIDELPILMIAAACASGITTIRGASELRVKESDRLHAMAEGLRTLGIDIQEYPDGIAIKGGQFKGGNIDSYGDHRIAMAFIIAAAVSHDVIIVEDCENIQTSFPGFIKEAQQLGYKISTVLDKCE